MKIPYVTTEGLIRNTTKSRTMIDNKKSKLIKNEIGIIL